MSIGLSYILFLCKEECWSLGYYYSGDGYVAEKEFKVIDVNYIKRR